MPDDDLSIVGATEALAQFSASVSYATVPQEVRERMKECFLDFIGNTSYAAQNVESSLAFRNAIRAITPEGPATVVGVSEGYPHQYAALLNGAYAHTLDFDDTNLFGSLHPGAPVVAAAMAEAERVNASGEVFLAALAVGNEVACRVGAALGPTAYDRGFHITPVAGIFGAVAAAGSLRRMDAAGIASAYALAASRAAGSMQYLSNGAWNKRLHPGFAAHDALVSLALAEAGVVGAAAPIEGRHGLLNGYSNAPQPHLLTDRLGTWWAAAETAIKPYPSCRFAHAAIDAALNLRKQVSSADRHAVSLQVKLPPKAMQIVGERLPNKLRARTIVDGQFSVYFQIATAWLDGECSWQSYGRLGDADIEALAERMTVEADPSLPFAGAVLSVRGNPALTERVDDPLGEPCRPLGWDGVVNKFNRLAIPVYGDVHADAIAHRVRRLEAEASVADLIHTLRAKDRE